MQFLSGIPTVIQLKSCFHRLSMPRNFKNSWQGYLLHGLRRNLWWCWGFNFNSWRWCFIKLYMYDIANLRLSHSNVNYVKILIGDGGVCVWNHNQFWYLMRLHAVESGRMQSVLDDAEKSRACIERSSAVFVELPRLRTCLTGFCKNVWCKKYWDVYSPNLINCL